MTTYHSLQRARERTGLSLKSSARLIGNAFERGKEADHFTAAERKFLERKVKDGCRALYYNGYCFIVSADDYCITMYQAPEWFGKKHYDGKDEIRKAKKYMRLSDLYEQEDDQYGLCEVS